MLDRPTPFTSDTHRPKSDEFVTISKNRIEKLGIQFYTQREEALKAYVNIQSKITGITRLLEDLQREQRKMEYALEHIEDYIKDFKYLAMQGE